jgi:hypothetical protein
MLISQRICTYPQQLVLINVNFGFNFTVYRLKAAILSVTALFVLVFIVGAVLLHIMTVGSNFVSRALG